MTVLYIMNQKLFSASARLTPERAKRHKEKQQIWAHKQSSVIAERRWKLSIKIFADLNRNRFQFQCQEQKYAWNKQKLTGVQLEQSDWWNLKIETEGSCRVSTIGTGSQKISCEPTKYSLKLFSLTTEQTAEASLCFNDDLRSLILFWIGK